MADASIEKMVVGCACGAKFRVPAAAAGKKFKCPKCGGAVAAVASKSESSKSTVRPSSKQAASPVKKPAEAPKSAVPRKPPPVPPAGDGELTFTDDLLGSLAAHESKAEASIESRANVSICRNCSVQMSADAVLCVACGFDSRSGKRQMSASAPGEAASSKLSAKDIVAAIPKPSSNLILGITFSAIGALLGALGWFAILLYTGYEVMYVAWAVGALAGIGMAVGYKDKTSYTGILAAGIALAGIMSGRGFLVLHAVGSVALSDIGAFSKAVASTFLEPWGAIVVLLSVATAYGVASGTFGGGDD